MGWEDEPNSDCCNAPTTHYDKGNGEKYLACYKCFKPICVVCKKAEAVEHNQCEECLD